MAEANHTQGPWHVGMKPGPMVYGPSGEQVTSINVMLDAPENLANVRLISAAPEMLAALDELLALHDNAANNGPRPTTEQIEDWYKRVEKQARAAIAKARGE